MAIIDSTIIVADDLTGANDTALQFFKSGCKAKIIIDCEQDFSNSQDIDVWAISTESRNIDKKEAVDRIFIALEKLKNSLNPQNFYKKIDSTLRGNTGLEILAMLEAVGADACVVAPAYIEEKRTTVGGYQLLDGTPIERTQCALDPKAPILDSYIPNIIKKDFNPQLFDLIDVVGFNIVSKGAGPITLKINELIQKGKKIIIVDAASNVDLEQINLAIHKSSYKILPTGSAGLAQAMNKEILQDEKETKTNIQKIKHLPDLATLVVSGSATQLCAKQIQRLKEEKTNSYFVDLAVKDILNGVDEAMVEDIVSKLNSKINVIIHGSYLKQELMEEQAQNLLINFGIAKSEFSNKITDYLAELLAKINETSHFILVTIGGETSYKCAKKINSKYLELMDAIMPAIPLCKDAQGQIIVTKSGNFGTVETLLNISNYFKKLKANDVEEI